MGCSDGAESEESELSDVSDSESEESEPESLSEPESVSESEPLEEEQSEEELESISDSESLLLLSLLESDELSLGDDETARLRLATCPALDEELLLAKWGGVELLALTLEDACICFLFASKAAMADAAPPALNMGMGMGMEGI